MEKLAMIALIGLFTLACSEDCPVQPDLGYKKVYTLTLLNGRDADYIDYDANTSSFIIRYTSNNQALEVFENVIDSLYRSMESAKTTGKGMNDIIIKINDNQAIWNMSNGIRLDYVNYINYKNYGLIIARVDILHEKVSQFVKWNDLQIYIDFYLVSSEQYDKYGHAEFLTPMKFEVFVKQ